MSTTVKLADKTYTIKPLPIRASREWRAKFETPLFTLLGTTEAFSKISTTSFADGQALLAALGKLVIEKAAGVMQVLCGMTDTLLLALYDYCPEMKADAEYIETHAFDSEVVSAFVEVVQVAYPFGAIIRTLTKLGKVGSETSPNLPSPNGASTTTKSTP